MGKRKYVLNEDVFDKITELSAYWIGFLLADGCILDGGVVKLWLSKKDKDQIMSFLSFLESNYPIRKDKSGMYCGATIHSKKLCSSLMKHGVVPRKSHIAKVIGLQNDINFWRGMIDGDGTIYINGKYPIIRLVGSKAICEQFRDFVYSIDGGCAANVNKEKSIYSFAVAGSYAISLAKLCYGSCSVALKRKWKKAELVMKCSLNPRFFPVKDDELFVFNGKYRTRAIERVCFSCGNKFPFIPSHNNAKPNAGKYCSLTCLWNRPRLATQK